MFEILRRAKRFLGSRNTLFSVSPLVVIVAVLGSAIAHPIIALRLAASAGDPGAILQWQVVVTLLDLLGVGTIASLLAAGLLKFTDGTKIKPEMVVYFTCLAVSIVWKATFGLPAWVGDPDLYIASWVAFVHAARQSATVLYQVVFLRLFPAVKPPEPPVEPAEPPLPEYRTGQRI